MKKLILALCCIGLTVAATTAVYNQDNFNAAGRMFQPAPVGHVVGKDNGPGHGLHHAGEECGKCHSMGGMAEAYLWTTAGTLYADRSGRVPLKGGEVILQDRDGNVISLTSNEVGNFWTNAPIASNPYAVNAHGSTLDPLYTLDPEGNLLTPADPQNPITWQYKAWVKKGSAIRPMLTIAPAAGSSGMIMSCNMHHAPMGSRGALWVSPTRTLEAYPETGLSYSKHIYPILRSKCSPCHIPGSTMTRLVTKSDLDTPSTSIDISGGLDLLTFAGSTVNGVTKQGIANVVDTANPAQSRLLKKTTIPGPSHGGGKFWRENGQDYQALKQWITEGALQN